MSHYFQLSRLVGTTTEKLSSLIVSSDPQVRTLTPIVPSREIPDLCVWVVRTTHEHPLLCWLPVSPLHPMCSLCLGHTVQGERVKLEKNVGKFVAFIS